MPNPSFWCLTVISYVSGACTLGTVFGAEFLVEVFDVFGKRDLSVAELNELLNIATQLLAVLIAPLSSSQT